METVSSLQTGWSGNILTSSDNGTSWDNRTSGTTNHLTGAVSYGNSIFVATGMSGNHPYLIGQWNLLG